MIDPRWRAVRYPLGAGELEFSLQAEACATALRDLFAPADTVILDVRHPDYLADLLEEPRSGAFANPFFNRGLVGVCARYSGFTTSDV